MIVIKKEMNALKKINLMKDASLTVEAALIMPIFLYFMFAFLYFIQLFTIQEQIQQTITKMGLNLSKSAYFYKDFPDITEAVNFDKTIFDKDMDAGLSDISDKIMSGCSLKLYAAKYLNNKRINNSCIKDGFEGMDFFYSSIHGDSDCIDIVLKYKVKFPVKIFILRDMNMIQRVRLRAWTGYTVAAAYGKESKSDETMVYVTDTGTVYHKTKECSHIKLSITAAQGIPYALRNVSGAKYIKCEECCRGALDENAIYYITTYGTRYHKTRSCSGLKRSIREIPLSQVGSRRQCSRCFN